MFQGLRTVIYHVDDLEKAKAWYGKALKIKPYFDKPFYVGFNVGGYELGLDPDMTGVKRGAPGWPTGACRTPRLSSNGSSSWERSPTARCRRWGTTSRWPPSPTPSATSSASSRTPAFP